MLFFGQRYDVRLVSKIRFNFENNSACACNTSNQIKDLYLQINDYKTFFIIALVTVYSRYLAFRKLHELALINQKVFGQKHNLNRRKNQET